MKPGVVHFRTSVSLTLTLTNPNLNSNPTLTLTLRRVTDEKMDKSWNQTSISVTCLIYHGLIGFYKPNLLHAHIIYIRNDWGMRASSYCLQT